MAKLNPTAGYLHRSRPDFIRRGVPIGVAYQSRVIGRLAWSVSGNPDPERITEAKLAEKLETSGSKVQIVIDSGFVPRHDVTPRLWNAILQHKLVILPPVDRELSQYVPTGNETIHRAIADARGGTGDVEFITPIGDDTNRGRGVHYYVRLIGLRKQAAEIESRSFEASHGRAPTEDELEKRLQKLVQRGFALAKKGAADSEKPNLFFDEAIIVRACTLALERETETVILTRDNDLVEQFYKFGYLLDTHYRATVLSREFQKQPLNFPRSQVDSSETFLDQLVHSEGAELIRLPVEWHVVQCKACWECGIGKPHLGC